MKYWRRKFYWIGQGPDGTYWTGEDFDRREEEAKRFSGPEHVPFGTTPLRRVSVEEVEVPNTFVAKRRVS